MYVHAAKEIPDHFLILLRTLLAKRKLTPKNGFETILICKFCGDLWERNTSFFMIYTHAHVYVYFNHLIYICVWFIYYYRFYLVLFYWIQAVRKQTLPYSSLPFFPPVPNGQNFKFTGNANVFLQLWSRLLKWGGKKSWI